MSQPDTFPKMAVRDEASDWEQHLAIEEEERAAAAATAAASHAAAEDDESVHGDSRSEAPKPAAEALSRADAICQKLGIEVASVN